jgi:hypothetical protein
MIDDNNKIDLKNKLKVDECKIFFIVEYRNPTNKFWQNNVFLR